MIQLKVFKYPVIYFYRIILLVLIISISIRCDSQKLNQEFATFAFGSTIGGFICTAKTPLETINKRTVPVIGYNFGTQISYRKQKYYLESGLIFYKEGYCNVSSTIAPLNEKNEYVFQRLMLPLKVCIPIRSNFVKHLPALAFNISYALRSINYKSNNSASLPLVKEVYNVKSDYRRFNPSLSLIYGIEFEVESNVALRIEPNCLISSLSAKSQLNKTTIFGFGINCYLLFLK